MGSMTFELRLNLNKLPKYHQKPSKKIIIENIIAND